MTSGITEILGYNVISFVSLFVVGYKILTIIRKEFMTDKLTVSEIFIEYSIVLRNSDLFPFSDFPVLSLFCRFKFLWRCVNNIQE